LINDENQELYPGCESFSTLSLIIRLYLLKCLHGWSNSSFTDLLQLLKKVIPNLNIPKSFKKIKAMISDLGLDYKKIHACPKDCMLFWKENESLDVCSICKSSNGRNFLKTILSLRSQNMSIKFLPNYYNTFHWFLNIKGSLCIQTLLCQCGGMKKNDPRIGKWDILLMVKLGGALIVFIEIFLLTPTM